MTFSIRTAILLLICVGGLCAAASGQGNVFIKGLAPDWGQPYDYPDGFDATGPPAPPPPPPNSFWHAWCAPTAAVMLVGHWEDMKNRNGLADGSADGNPFNPPYMGANYGNGPTWHDYTADGAAGGAAGPNAQRGARPVNDMGWYMNTNGSGPGGGGHVGTFRKDVAAGINAFFAAKGTGGGQPAQNMSAATLGTHANLGGYTLQELAGFLKAEIDGDRTVIAHFTHWNLINQQGNSMGNGTEDSEDDFPIESWDFGAYTPGGSYGEDCNNDDDEYGIGHDVLVVGYTTNAQGTVTDIIVHDTWNSTGRNLKVPVGAQLVAITRVRGFSFQISDPIFAGGYGRFDVYCGASSSSTWLAYSLYGPGFYYIPPLNVELDIANPKQAGPMEKTDPEGTVSWTLSIPPQAAGLMIWFQALQMEQKTNVVETVIL